MKQGCIAGTLSARSVTNGSGDHSATGFGENKAV